jgi:SAM-dependent methyltransferase
MEANENRSPRSVRSSAGSPLDDLDQTARMTVPALTRPGVRLFLTSAALLFAELLFIRWIPSNIIYVGFFNNFILMASFLGIGLGVLSGRSAGKPQVDPAPLLLFVLIAVVLSGRLNVAPPTNDEVFIGATPRELVDVNVLVLGLVVVLTTLAMAALARPLAPLFRTLPPLRAYATDVAGALLGIVVFAALSALSTPPLAWFAVLVALLALLGLGAGVDRTAIVTGSALACILALGVFDLAQGDHWSAYHRLTLRTLPDGVEEISVNGIPYQAMTPASLAAPYFTEVYRQFPGRTFARALVIGAGTGNDTSAALRNGVVQVDAVDIDPLILDIGVARHPDRPYDDARVHRYVDDGRAFLRRSDQRYDLIVFAQTDSFVLVGNSANVRLESFLFTREAFESAREHLAPGGVVVLYNAYREPFLVDRYATTVREVFSIDPIVRIYPEYGGAFRAWLAVGPPRSTAPLAFRATTPSVGPAIDDWPFPYLRDRGIAPRYLLALGLMVALSVVAIAITTRRGGASSRGFSPHFFVLGVAFLLLETRSLVTFSLLFGTTWIVNALAFFGILLVVLAAIGVNVWLRIPRAWPIYAAIFIALAANALLPPTALLFDPTWLRYGVAAALVFAPIFLANVAFSFSFRDSRAADMAFASNVLGAMVGGVIEWTALVTGYQSLLAVAALLYLFAYVLATRWRFLADRELRVAHA